MEHVPASWITHTSQCSVGNRGHSNGSAMLIKRTVQWNMFLFLGMPLYFSVLFGIGGVPMERVTLLTRTVKRNMFLLLGMPLYFSVLLGTGGVQMERVTLLTRTVKRNTFLLLGLSKLYFSVVLGTGAFQWNVLRCLLERSKGTRSCFWECPCISVF